METNLNLFPLVAPMCCISDPTTLNNLNDSHREMLTQWWEALCRQAEPDNSAEALRQNLENDRLFELEENCLNRLAGLAQQLSDIDNLVDPVERLKEAIKAQEPPSVVCAGPSADPPSNPFVRLIIAADLYKWNRKTRNTEENTQISLPTITDPQYQRRLNIWARSLVEVPGIYLESLQGQIRGKLPVAFWTCQQDIEENFSTPFSANRLRNFLGLESLEPSCPLHLLIRVEEQNLEREGISRHVPTGWDAFTHQHFRPMSPSGNPEQIGNPPRVGMATDIQEGTEGGHEFVTPPVPIELTEPYQVVS